MSNDDHVTVRLSNADLRAIDDWYSMHYHRDGLVQVFSDSRLEKAAKDRKKRADKRKQNRKDKRDRGDRGGGAGEGGSTGTTHGKTSTKSGSGQKNTSSVDSTTTTGGTQTCTARTAHGAAHILRGKEHHTKDPPTRAGMTTVGGRGGSREQSGGPDLGVNVNAKPHLKAPGGKKAAEIRDLPHRSHPGPYTAQARYTTPRATEPNGSRQHGKVYRDARQDASPNRDHPGASVSAGYKASAKQGLNMNDGPPNATRVPSRRPDHRHGD